MITYGVRDRTIPLGAPVGDVVETFLTRDAAERFIAECVDDEPDLADVLEVVRIELDGDNAN
jgi:hypothetical protein